MILNVEEEKKWIKALLLETQLNAVCHADSMTYLMYSPRSQGRYRWQRILKKDGRR